MGTITRVGILALIIFIGSGAMRVWFNRTVMYGFVIFAGLLLIYWVIDAMRNRG